MSRSRRTAALALVALTGLTGLAGGTGAATAATPAGPAYTVTTLHFEVEVGPTGSQTCDVVGDLYVPKGASAGNRVPAVLSTNGFGGSKDDQAGLSKLFASRGYVALSYSGLGFGGSTCEIALDDPDYDGKAAAQLIDYLGGKAGIAYRDRAHTTAVPSLGVVELDGPAARQDPRVGMFGGSYGGQVQYAAASVTSKLDTIVPFITWNDLSYSLGPNNTDQIRLPGQEQVGVSTDTPGSVKTNWALAFSAVGLTGDVANQQPDNPLSSRCPNFVDFVCPALVQGAATGTLDDASIARLRHASVASYQDEVRIPTLILQGQADTLFNLDEAVATYQALKAQGTPVKMAWLQYGHSGAPAPGEIDFARPDPTRQHITKRVVDWFAHYLQDSSVGTGPEFSYFQDWVRYTGNARQAYRSASYPVGSTSTYHLSSTPTSSVTGGTLVTDRSEVTAGREDFTVPAGPTSGGEDVDVISTFFEEPEALEPVEEAPGTYARYDTAALTTRVDVVGSPKVRLQVQAPTVTATQGQDPGKLVLYLKVADVAPDGTARVVRNLAAPVRVPDVGQPFTTTMPAFVHRFEQGHKIRLVVAGASPNYRGNNAPAPVTLLTAPDGDATEALPLQSITLPTTTGVPPSETPGTGTGDGSGTPGTPGTDGAGTGNGSGNGPGNGSVPGTDTSAGDVGGAQAAPASSTATTGATTSALPDTGGPRWDLLAGGLALVLLGAGQVLIGRRTTT